jgi:hypothetical protein
MPPSMLLAQFQWSSLRPQIILSEQLLFTERKIVYYLGPSDYAWWGTSWPPATGVYVCCWKLRPSVSCLYSTHTHQQLVCMPACCWKLRPSVSCLCYRHFILTASVKGGRISMKIMLFAVHPSGNVVYSIPFLICCCLQ